MGPFLGIPFLLITFPYVLSITWPRNGCTGDYNAANCQINVYCVNNLNYLDSFIHTKEDLVTNIDHRYNNCSNNNYFYSPNYGTILSKISLTYRYNLEDSIHTIPLPDYAYQMAISTFDVSSNRLSICPNVMRMDNLIYLNMSMNSISVAKFSNVVELPLLREIDLSNNIIKTIKVNDENEFPYKNLTKLNLSHNLLTTIPDAIFDTFSKLTSLDLSFNFILFLGIGTFEGIKRLIHLDISHNKIVDINSSLFRFTDLETFNISHNQIRTIDATDFAMLKKLESVDFSYNNIVNLEKTIFYNMILLKTVNLNNNEIYSIDRDAFFNNTYLTKIDISNNKLKILPKDLFKDKNLIVFSITGNTLEGPIVKGLFQGLRFVLKLDLSNQCVTSIEDYTFFGLERIQELFINNNDIGSLSKNSFKSLQSLVHLDLSNNRITSIDFDKEDLVSLRSFFLRNNFLTQIKYEYYNHLNSLRFLDLSYNNISSLESKAFKSLRDLIIFQIYNNPLSGALQEGTFDGLNALPSLDISKTHLTIINNNSFSGMSQLKYFNISHSNLTVVQYNAFSHTGSIKSLDLSYNAITTFSINCTEMKNLHTLLLNNNRIKSIYANYFHGFDGLKNINLANNNIQKIESDTFFGQPNLISLDLSYNSKLNTNISQFVNNKHIHDLILSGIRTNIVFTNVKKSLTLSRLDIAQSNIENVTKLNLQVMPHIKYLNLKDNKIQKLVSGAFFKLYDLINLDLSYNLITNVQAGSFKDNNQLQCLNISHNSLTAITYGILRGLNSLQILDMSYNFIDDMDSERFYEAENLKELILDHNNIYTISAEEFVGTNLEVLSIGDNPLPCDIIVNLKKSVTSFNITSIRFDIHNENSHGITCKKNRAITQVNSDHTNESKSLENEKVLFDIRDIMMKLAKEYNTYNSVENKDTEYWKIIKDNIEKSSNTLDKSLAIIMNQSLAISIESIKTNILLQKILKTMVFNNTLQIPQTSLSKDNATYENLVTYINKMKQDIGSVISVEKQNVLDELESKISYLNSRVKSVESLLASTKQQSSEKLIANKDPTESTHQSWFIETCVALILIIIVIYILYKFYKSNMFMKSRRTYSSRELPGSMESPNL
ncbi:toll-like receptor 3 [Achroia grisella]|uniref:toll-like receptor 3 n=1 Tax=Achroia grisella TaxID=688607 RepID=UPI0027D2EB54|nr:toll-like receptor 3 [Achroia grisella]